MEKIQVVSKDIENSESEGDYTVSIPKGFEFNF